MESKASAYRHEAKQLRRAAKATDNQITRATLLNLAEEFERMARYPVEHHPKMLRARPSSIARYGDPEFKV